MGRSSGANYSNWARTAFAMGIMAAAHWREGRHLRRVSSHGFHCSCPKCQFATVDFQAQDVVMVCFLVHSEAILADFELLLYTTFEFVFWCIRLASTIPYAR